MTKRQQIKMVLEQKQKLEKQLVRALSPWIKGIAAEYRIGDQAIQQDNADDLRAILRRFYNQAANYLLGYDVRQYKQVDDPFEAMRHEAASQLENISYVHNLKNSTLIAQTASGWVRRVSDLATANGLTIGEARQMLISHLRAHSLTIATTETQFITEATRNFAVMLVNDPLKNSVIQVADLIAAGDTNAAVRLSRYVMKLVRQPLSISQGSLISVLREKVGLVGARSQLMTPLVQGRIVANLTERANALGKPKKEWSAVFHNTRPAHMDAEGQQRWIGEPFNVGGALLQYPGDGSLGAPLNLIVNCACSAIHI